MDVFVNGNLQVAPKLTSKIHGLVGFVKHWEMVLDMILVVTALVLTITFHETELDASAETIAELVLLILRLVRLMHAISTIIEERKEEEIEALKKELNHWKAKNS